jgi:predicted metalloendopeptidase
MAKPAPTSAGSATPAIPTFQHFNPKAADTAVDPCSDFFHYSCNTWIKENPIPPDRGRWTTGGRMDLAIQFLLKDILEKTAQPGASGNQTEKQLGNYYAACMDESTVNARGIGALQQLLDRVNQLASKAELPPLLADIHAATFHMIPDTDSGGFTPFFFYTSAQDLDDASVVVASVDQGGLGLPDRDYYLKTDPKSVETRTAYVAHVQKMLELSGEAPDKAPADSKVVLDFETALAHGTKDLVTRRDPAQLNHKLSLNELQALSPSFDWNAYLKQLSSPPTAHYLVQVPEYVQAMDAQIKARSLDDLKTYLRWHVLHSHAGLLSAPVLQEDFAFYNQRLQGAKELAPRWKRCNAFVNRDMGEALGVAFVAKAFPPESKDRMEHLVHDLSAALGADLGSIDWMGPETRQQAEQKLAAFLDKIGYPTHPRDYSSVPTERDKLVEDAEGLSGFELRRQLNRIGRPVDKQEWDMTAQTVNAYYDPQKNSINFPSGILQPPMFDATMDDAVNYGAIGAVIGHEMTHGFDDQGSKFDATGNLRNWWTPQDGKNFAEREQCIDDEYSSFTVLDGLHLNGKLTLGENTADNGGLRIAHAAWLTAQQRAGHAPTVEDEQRFFLSFGQTWCSAYTYAALRLQVQSNPHSPPQFRVNGTVRNMPEFQKAFGCKVGAPMAPEKPCHVW